MKRIILFCTVVLMMAILLADLAVGAGKRVVVLPFYDDSGYRGPWKLYYEVPEMLGDMIMDDYFYIVPMDSVIEAMAVKKKKSAVTKFFNLFRNVKAEQKLLSDLEVLTVGRKFDADYAIFGLIDQFKFKRQGAGDVIVGGYKSYVANVELSGVRVLRVADGTPMGTVRGESEKTERGLGLEIMGKPRKRDLEFYSLDSLDFRSKRFLNTLMGQATVEALNKVQKEVRAIITLPDTAWYAEKKFKVVSSTEGVISINAGSADGVKAGDKFRVFASESGILVGKINVTTVWADHLSKCEVLEGRDAIRDGDIIMPER